MLPRLNLERVWKASSIELEGKNGWKKKAELGDLGKPQFWEIFGGGGRLLIKNEH